MVRLAAVLIGTYVLSFGATAYVDQVMGGAAPATQGVRGDMLDRSRPSSSLASVSSVELIGLSGAMVTLRDRDGRVLYQTDPLSNTTLVARDADIPVVTLRDHSGVPVVRREIGDEGAPAAPARTDTTQDRPAQSEPEAERTPRRVVGCESGVSVLASRAANAAPSLCLASL